MSKTAFWKHDRVSPGFFLKIVWFLMTGRSVKEFVEACKKATGVDIKVEYLDRRPGDYAEVYSDPSKILRELNWTAQYTNLQESLQTAWRWQKSHRNGYGTRMSLHSWWYRAWRSRNRAGRAYFSGLEEGWPESLLVLVGNEASCNILLGMQKQRKVPCLFGCNISVLPLCCIFNV